ncbi:G-protein coupled receptor GRL101-like [Asterias amurensis]|uniref:G-protein coupled receptor GRL101-like n=1 Tax=Asterias amurensis TaxID=7602 RepID=UPI003AB83D40
MDNPLLSINSGAFNSLSNLKKLYLIRGKWTNERSTLNIDPGALEGLHSLEILYVDDYRLCCRFDEEVPSKEFDYSKCTTTELQPPLNICGSLMRNDPLRASLWILGLSALIGNLVVIIWRCRRGKELGENETHSFLVLNLAISDLMMGVYMLIIAIADILLGKSYSSVAKEWRSSVVCKIAGVVSVMSSEASVFFVTLISLDCFLSIVFPFSRVTIRGKISKVIVVILWLVSACVSIIPTVFSGDSDSNVYGLSDVCIGLPLITKVSSYSFVDNSISSVFGSGSIAIPVPDAREPAWIYSIVLFLGVNLFCFIVVLSCYIAIFVQVKRSSKLVKVTAHRQREVKMAIKMALIVGIDFACWMPVIIMGILSQAEIVEIGPDMYAWIVVFILPINSSLNPYLYTFYSKITGQSNTKKPEPKVEMKITKSTETLETRASENNIQQ